MQTRKVVTMLASAVALSGAAHAGDVLGTAKVVKGANLLAKGKDTVSVRFAGRTEFEYSTSGSDDGFSFRRLRLGSKAKLGSGFTAETVVDYAADAGRRGKSGKTGIRKAIVSYKLNDMFKVVVGRDKVVFGYEETSSSSKGVFLERSALNNTLESDSALGFAVQNNVTLKAKFDGGFNAAVSFADQTDDTGGNSSIFGRVQWKGDAFTVGADYASNDADSVSNNGFTAYVNYSAEGFTVLGEFFDADLGGAASDVDGFAVRASYKFGKVEPVVRYSKFDKGADEVEEIYAGVNFYLAPQVTLLTGYQDIDSDNDADDSDALTARLRLLW